MYNLHDRQALGALNNFEISSEQESPVMTLIGLHGVVFGAVESFKQITSDSGSWEGHNRNSKGICELDESENMEEENGGNHAERALVSDGTRNSSTVNVVGFQ